MGFESEIRIIELNTSSQQIDLIQIIDKLFALGWLPGIDGKISTIEEGDSFNFIEINFGLTGCVKLFDLLRRKTALKEYISVNFSHINGQQMIQMSYDCKSSSDELKFAILCEDKSESLLTTEIFFSKYLKLLRGVIYEFNNPIIELVTGYDYEVIQTLHKNDIEILLNKLDKSDSNP